MPLTDTQLVLLSAAAQHPDGLLPRPDKLSGAALQKMSTALFRAGLAEAVPVRADQPCWRRDAADTPVGLRITTAGLTAIGVEPPAHVDVTTVVQPSGEQDGTKQGLGDDTPPLPAASRMFRSGSKLAQLVALLSAAEGTGIDALVTALGWQPHTVRAALTRLRQDGLDLAKNKDAAGKTVYRIIEAAEAGDPDAAGSAAPNAGATR